MIRVDNNNGKNLYFGHQNPDTIASAIIMADFEQLTGNSEATPYRLGDITYILDIKIQTQMQSIQLSWLILNN